jgi:hypothetical protein
MNLTTEEYEDLEQATTEVRWSEVCDRIKAARENRYPPDWYQRVIVTGLLARKHRLFRGGGS